MAQLDDTIASSTETCSAPPPPASAMGASREEAAFTPMVLVGAEAETTTSLIGSAIAVLAERPRLQDELRTEPAKIAPFIEEVLRFESPFRYHPRTAARSVALVGVEIPEGALVHLLRSSANRDETVFEAPDEIAFGRRNSHLHLGFWARHSPLRRSTARATRSARRAHQVARADEMFRPRSRSTATMGRQHVDPCHQYLPVLIEPV